MRRSILALLLLVAALPGVAHTAPASRVRVGYGEADATWHVGSGSGQYTETDPNLAHAVDGEVDPFNHSWKQRHSYGVQSRLSIRAIVVEGSNRKRLALVKTDNYLAADALTRRAAQILDEAGTSGIHYSDIMQMASHNHSSPFYFSPSWGVWLFQDLIDLRTFEYEARQMALAIERAAANLRPARMGATVIKDPIYKGQIAGATIGDDGTPAGYPDWTAAFKMTDRRADFGITVIRFDEVPSGKPIAVLANHGQHPESLDGYDLITGDYLAAAERMVQRDLGAKLVLSQGDVGSAEGPYCRPKDDCSDVSGNDVLPDGVVRAWAHVGHAQTERGARRLADAIERAYTDIGRGRAIVNFTTDFPVVAGNAWVPGPVSHPYPSVSNCRSETTFEGNPGLPVTGLPDCDRGLVVGDPLETDPAATQWEQLKAAGLPMPEHYDAASFGAVQEHLRLHLQAFRMGEVVLASCACEAQMDLILNFESRANKAQGDIYDGYDYPCTKNADGTYACKSGSFLQQTVTVPAEKYARMRAQVHNDAAGWEDPENALASNTESSDPSAIKGNFTKEELPARIGYALPVGVGMAGDYNGYVVSYREYMIRDHYRKALTAYGPHTADYMVTRMVRLAASLKGGPALAPEPLDPVAIADEVREEAFMQALGRLSSAVYDAWLASLPSDAGAAGVVTQPKNITRFQAATFSWRGGSNAIDNPTARVERLVGGRWRAFADQSGEVQTMVALPSGASGVLDAYSGNQEWIWTANFEAFSAFPRTVVPGGQTPAGTYRFVVDGVIRSGGENEPYHFVSNAFSVSPWKGITVTNAKRHHNGSVSFTVVPVAYPRSYASPFRYISDDKNPKLCRTCSFRPWARTASIASAIVRVVHANGKVEYMRATRSGNSWVVRTKPSDRVTIEPGGIRDAFGETNGSRVLFGLLVAV